MIAKFPGTCPFCGEWFPVGTVVAWKRGSKAAHTACAAAPAAAEEARKEKRAAVEAEFLARAKFEKAAHRIAHTKHGSCFANMHEVAAAMVAAGCGAVNRIGERKPGEFAARWAAYPKGAAFLSVLTFPCKGTVEMFKNLGGT